MCLVQSHPYYVRAIINSKEQNKILKGVVDHLNTTHTIYLQPLYKHFLLAHKHASLHLPWWGTAWMLSFWNVSFSVRNNITSVQTRSPTQYNTYQTTPNHEFYSHNNTERSENKEEKKTTKITNKSKRCALA